MVERYARRILMATMVSAIVIVAAGCSGSSTGAGSTTDAGNEKTHVANESDLPPVVHHSGEMDHDFPAGAPEHMRTIKNPIGKGTQSDMDKGEALFQANCVRCHGENGNGNGPGAQGLTPPPADFTSGHFSMMSDEVVYYIMTTGIKGSAMPTWTAITSEDRWRIIHYLRSLAPANSDESGGHGMHDM